MIISMTGFASKSYDFSWGSVNVEISSINSKYQDFSVKLPKELASLENRMLAIMRRLIARGRVRLSAEINWAPGGRIPVIDEKGFVNFYKQVERIAMRNSLQNIDSITNFLLIPGIFELNDNLAEQEAKQNPELWDTIAEESIDLLNEMRRSEGDKMREVIEADLNLLEGFANSMKERWKVARDVAIENIRQRIEDVLQHYSLELDEARISEEVTLASDRWDISEEIARLEAHVGKFRQTLEATGPTGKKLDFLIQEMNREINTMGSKVPDAEFRWLVVESKTCVERMREQIQNVE